MSHNVTLTRRQNVLALFQSYAETMIASGVPPKGLEQAFAAAMQISPSMWSQIKSARPIGDKLARQLEKLGGKSAGWLDHPNTLPRFDAKPIESRRMDAPRVMDDNEDEQVNKFALLAPKWYIKVQLLSSNDKPRKLDKTTCQNPDAPIVVICPDLRNKKSGMAAEISIVAEGPRQIPEIAVIGAITQAASHWINSLPQQDLRIIAMRYTLSKTPLSWISIATAKAVEVVAPKILSWLDRRLELGSSYRQELIVR